MNIRNKICHCGSNIKYKKCCGRNYRNNVRSLSAEEHCGLGRSYIKQNMLGNAAACFLKALELNADCEEAYFCLGIVSNNLGKHDEAISYYQKALSVNPFFPTYYLNLADIYLTKKSYSESAKSLYKALENSNYDRKISDFFIKVLNLYNNRVEFDCQYIIAQRSLQQINPDYPTSPVGDEFIRQVYRQCRDILLINKLDINTNMTQLYRGLCAYPYNCSRNRMVFNNYNVIPEYCFDCYKVTIELRSVMELFKLLLVFNKLNLPNGNVRKCAVELRKWMSGNYKGYIYCQGISEGNIVLNIVKPILEKEISKGISVFLKRGCSEFSIAYPSFGQVSDNISQHMVYNEEWREYEALVDMRLAQCPIVELGDFSTYDHPGFTLLDAVVMRKWLEYAAIRDDKSYLNIEPNLNIGLPINFR